LALLIDGDNAQPDLFELALSAVQTFGQVIVKRVYGDLNSSYLQRWKQLADDNDMHPPSPKKYNGAKNQTDWRLGLDAVRMVDEHQLDGVCIMSSDQDYITPALEIMEKEKFVVMIGRESSRQKFRDIGAFYLPIETQDKRTWLMILGIIRKHTQSAAQPAPTPQPTTKAAPPPAKPQLTAPPPAKPAPLQITPTPITPQKASNTVSQKILCSDERFVCKTVFATVAGTNEWVTLAQYTSVLVNAGVNYKMLGHSTMLKFVKAYPDLFEVREVKNPKGTTHHIRLKATL
jgi:hypothetical protein